jgi:hypothetical protein
MYAERTTNELCSLFNKTDKAERHAYIEELHNCEVMLFKMSIYSPAIVNIIKAPIDEYFKLRYSSSKKGITKIARGLRSETTGLTIRSRGNSEDVKQQLSGDLESTLAYIVMSLTMLSEACDEEKEPLIDQTSDMLENILLHESIRAQVFQQIKLINQKYKSIKRAFSRTMREEFKIKGVGLAEDILLNDVDSESVEIAELNTSEFDALRAKLLAQHNHMLNELLDAIGIQSVDSLGDICPQLSSAFLYKDRISHMRFAIVDTVNSYIHQIVKRKVPLARDHAVSHEDVVQTCVARLTDNIFTYNPVYSLTTFSRYYIELDCKEQLEKSSMVRLKQLMSMQKTVIEGGLVNDEFGHETWCWKSSQKAIKERYKLYLDQKTLLDIRFGYTVTDSMHAEGDAGESFALTDHLGIGHEDEHIRESMLVEEVLGLITDLSEVEQGIVKRKLIAALDTDNKAFKGMQFNDEECDPEVLKVIRSKLEAVRQHLR